MRAIDTNAAVLVAWKPLTLPNSTGLRAGIRESLVAEEPFALVAPEHAFVRGELSEKIVRSMLHAQLLERLSRPFAEAAETWLSKHGLQARRHVDCELGSEILACAGFSEPMRTAGGSLVARTAMKTREFVTPLSAHRLRTIGRIM